MVYSTPQKREMRIMGTDISNVSSAIMRNARIGRRKISFVLDTVISFLHRTEKNLFTLLMKPSPAEDIWGRFLFSYIIKTILSDQCGFVLL